MSTLKMSERAAELFALYVHVMRAQFEGTEESASAMDDVLFTKMRLEETYGHVEHEILADELEALLNERKAAA